MSIWVKKPGPSELAEMAKRTIDESLGIEIVEIGDDYVVGTMPVDHRTCQPMGLLHGGASAVLAETLGSIGASYCVDGSKYYCVGVDINATHLRSVRQGKVKGIGRPVHLGKSIHVWEIRISDDEDNPVCIARITLAVRRYRESPADKDPLYPKKLPGWREGE